MSEMVRTVARAICKSRTCEGVACCQWPAQGGRTYCPVKLGAYDDAARAAIEAWEAMVDAALTDHARPVDPAGGGQS